MFAGLSFSCEKGYRAGDGGNIDSSYQYWHNLACTMFTDEKFKEEKTDLI